ncbi:hypothetical protein BH11MYX4_BH11MYX4_13210 [soil metagenome]
MNDAARALWKDAAAGVDAPELLPEAGRDALRAAAAAVLATGQAASFEWGEHGPGDVRWWFSFTLSALREGDVVTGYLCISTDLTATKRTELRLRRAEQLMVDAQGVAHLGMWEWDVSQPEAQWSAELYRIYGLMPETYRPTYDAYLTMIHPEDRQRVIDATNRVFHEHVPYSHDERIFRPDGTIRYLHTWAHPVLDDAGKLTRLVGVCQDITDQKVAEQHVKDVNADLERRVAERTRTIENSIRDVEAFNATLSHDLRAPLSVIQLTCEVMQMEKAEPLPAAISENLARIQRSVAFMTALVNDLLTLAQVGHANIERSELDLTSLADEILTNLRRGAPRREVSVDVAPGLTCSADPGLMRAAMENLLGNAWKYSSRVAPARIEVGSIDDERGRTFFVRDNGAGFDMSQAHRLFAPFERLHTASEFEGTGIGLAAVNRIIERHGGRIWAESAPGRGATFFFALSA